MIYEENKPQEEVIVAQQDPTVVVDESFPEISSEEAAIVFPVKNGKKDLSNIERFHTLQSSFNAIFDDTVKKYLVETCRYPNITNIDELRGILNTKFIRNSKAKTVKGEEKVIKAYLKSLVGIFECLYKEYKKDFLPNPALFYKRIEYLISKIESGAVKKVNKTQIETLCNSVLQEKSGGLVRKKTRRNKKTRKTRRVRNVTKRRR
jgi:hypothetical protein